MPIIRVEGRAINTDLLSDGDFLIAFLLNKVRDDLENLQRAIRSRQ